MLTLNKPSKSQKIKAYAQRGMVFLLASVLVLTIAQPSEVMGLINFMNPPAPQRHNVMPLKSATNDPKALPHDSSVGQSTLEATDMEKTKVDRTPLKEIVGKRTSHSKTFLNKDGTSTVEYMAIQQHYKENNKWLDIDNSLDAVQPPDGAKRLDGKAGSLSASMRPLSEGIVIEAEGKTITIKPEGAKNAVPQQKDETTVVYRDAWPDVDLEYELRGESVKEIIIVKSKNAQTNFNFSVGGGTVVKHPSKAGELTIAGLPEEYSFSALTLDVNGRGVISEERVTQEPSAGGIAIKLDNAWFKSQPNSAFPMRIDPTLARQGDAAMNYKMFRNDGFSCNASNCYANIGTVNDSVWKHWRTYINFDYTPLTNKTVLNADLYGWYKSGIGGSSTSVRTTTMGLASCSSGFNCAGSTAGTHSTSTNFNIDFTAKLKALVDADDYSSWWSIRGTEIAAATYKPYYDMKATIVYDTPTPMAAAAAPADKATIVNTQPSLRVNTATDTDGDAVKYYFRVATNPDAETGAVINSGWIDSSQWTVPDNILQDGRTYYWHVYTKGYAQTNPTWIRSFKVDMRTGKDSTQAYEDLGPISADLATGNATTGTGSHSISALGGDIGISLDYNSPAMSRPGLVGQYWNNTTFNGSPVLERVDPDINFSWATGSPSPSVVNTDNFSSRWAGYITVPTTGDYIFGCDVDDKCNIYINDELYFQRTSQGSSYAADPIQLEAGKPASIKIEHIEGTGNATMQLRVKGAVAEQPVPTGWYDTGTRQTATKYGLEGRYYKAGSGGIFPADPNDPNTLLMVRGDNKLNFNWGTGAASPGLPSDNFVVRWKGYITVPETGSYTLGGNADMGIRIKTGTGMFGADQTLLDSWSGSPDNRWGSAVNLVAGQPVPVTVEGYEGSGEASFNLLIKGTGLAEQEMPVTWLAPNASTLPDGWELGLGDGDINYERLQISSNAAILSDSTGQKHEYTWKNNGYVPPKSQEAVLTRNDDNTYTVLDTDGKTYIFDVEGKLQSATSPEDDRQPAALKYEYAGNPSRLMKVSDGVNETRNGTLHYKGVNDSECETLSGFDAAPDGILCAFKTTDGKKTTFQYKSGNLARVAQPGDDYEDYGYDNFGRIVSYRDPLANDAIAYGVRDNNAEATNEISYDGLGRAEKIKAPAPTAGAPRVENTVAYLSGATKLHTTGASEPHGFSKKITYDELFRTTAETDLANLTTTTQWHPDKDLVLSSTDPTGLKSTTIYNEDDMPVDGYGPVPAAWFGSDRKPLAEKVNDVPHVKTGYDEGLNGVGVAYYDNKKLLHAPKLNSTVTWPTTSSVISSFASDSAPVTPTDGWGARYTGKIKLNSAGNHTFKLRGDGGFRLYIDDQLYVDGWGDGTLSGGDRTITGTAFNNTVAGSTHRIRVEQYHAATGATSLQLYMTAPGAIETSVISSLFSPGYGLETSSIAYDSELGNTETQAIYSAPEYGLVGKTVIDPSGLNYENKANHEAPGSGFLRQTGKTLPGGSTTQYQYYTASETRDNPCTPELEAIYQGGFSKSTSEPDPDGEGAATGRASEAIYDATGNVVAMRYNDEPWTCTTYDARDRLQSVAIPAYGGKSGRTINYDYLVDGDPLKTSMSDPAGTITTKADLLGRTVGYTDASGKTTQTSYDMYGKMTSKISPIGTETYEYNTYDRLISHKLDSAEFASVSYDDYGRVENTDYGAGVSLNTIDRDQLGRETGLSFSAGDSQAVSDNVSRYVSGEIKNGVENGVSKSYSYDAVGRLVSAEIGDNNFAYGFGSGATECSTYTGNNTNAGRSGNRTQLTTNGQTTTYCYDEADRLVGSSDNTLTDVQYDTHGNTTSIGDTSHKTELEYDTSDRNTSVASGTKETTYVRDAQDRVISRQLKDNGTTVEHIKYGFTDNSDALSFTLDNDNEVVRAYLSLPGGVLVTINPESTSAGATTYSLPNLHGDVMTTVNAEGALTGKYMTGPFGETLPVKPALLTEASPANTGDTTSVFYLGRHQKLTDTTTSPISGGIIQMGARPYLPALGRFLAVDPIDGGTDNTYAYANDPVNQHDSDGEAVWFIPVAVAIGRYAVQHYLKKQAAKKAADTARKRVAQEAAKRRAAAIRSNTLKRITGIERQIKLHRQKLADYIRNPYRHDNQGYLRRAGNNKALQRKIIQTRIQNLKGQIRMYQNEVGKFRSKL